MEKSGRNCALFTAFSFSLIVIRLVKYPKLGLLETIAVSNVRFNSFFGLNPSIISTGDGLFKRV